MAMFGNNGWQDRLRQAAPRQPAANPSAPTPPRPLPQGQPPQTGHMQPPRQPPQTGHMQPGRQPPQMQPPRQPPQMQPPRQQPATNFNQHMRNMRRNYRGSMEAAGLSGDEIRNRMGRMRRDQRANRSQIANQYMQERLNQQQPPQMQPPRQNPYAQMPGPPRQNWQPPAGPSAPAAPPQRMPATPAAPQMRPVQPGQAPEQFNQRGLPTPSRANLLPAQQPGSWAQRMYGGMRGAPANTPNKY